MRWLLALAAAASLTVAPAWAQDDTVHIARKFPGSHGATTAAAMDERLQETAANLAAQEATASRIAEFDMAWPSDGPEYKALGGWAIILVTVVAADPAELPLKRTYIHREQGDLDLTPIATRKTLLSAASQVAKQVGRYRQDIFYLAPIALLLKDGGLRTDFAVNRQGFVIAALPFELPDVLSGASGVGMPEVGAVKKLFEREFRGFTGVEALAFAP